MSEIELAFYRFLVQAHLCESPSQKKRQRDAVTYRVLIETEHPIVFRAQAESARIIQKRMGEGS